MGANSKKEMEATLDFERRKFTQLLAQGVTGVANVVGQTVTNGDIVFLAASVPQQYVIVDVAPVLDKPYVGALNVTLLGLPMTVEVRSGTPVGNLLPSGLKGSEFPRELLELLTEYRKGIVRRVDMIKHVDANEEPKLPPDATTREAQAASLLVLPPDLDEKKGDGDDNGGEGGGSLQ